MTKILFKWMMAIAIVASPMVFTACGDDDENDGGNGGYTTVDASKADVIFSIPLSADLLQYCEGTISFTDAKGNSVVEDFTSSNITNNVWIVAVKDYTLPAPIKFEVVFKAKDADAIGKMVYSPTTLNVKYQLKDANGQNLGNAIQQQLTVAPYFADPNITLSTRQGTMVSHVFTLYQSGLKIISDNLNPVAIPVVSFEYQTLNDLGFWVGEENENGYESFGSMVYPCEYHESYIALNTTYGVSYWSGYAISNRTEKGFTSGDLTPRGMPDQFNNVTGKAHSGKNFCVIYPYGETIRVGAKSANAKGVQLKGFWYTNSSYTAYAIENGDGMSDVPGGFTKDDWFKCIVTGTKADATTVSVEIMLAKDGNYVKDWQFADLSSMGQIKSLSFSFEGTKQNQSGLTTPAYMCIDDIEE